VQKLLNILPKVHQQQQSMDKAGANHHQVQVELQADCLAGVWANHEAEHLQTAGRPRLIESGDINAALKTASAIGDDTLQQGDRSGGAGQLHARHFGAAAALVHERLPGRHSGGMQYIEDGESINSIARNAQRHSVSLATAMIIDSTITCPELLESGYRAIARVLALSTATTAAATRLALRARRMAEPQPLCLMRRRRRRGLCTDQPARYVPSIGDCFARVLCSPSGDPIGVSLQSSRSLHPRQQSGIWSQCPPRSSVGVKVGAIRGRRDEAGTGPCRT
jgi:hypothetical protein